MPTRIDTIDVDVTLSERHGQRVELTVHPVEQGMNPTDHARLAPARYSLEGLFSNLPLGGLPVAGIARDATDTPVKKASDKLWRLLADRNAVTVTTELRTYQNMVLTELQMPRDPAMGDVVQFSAQFDEVRFVVVGQAQLLPVTSVPQTPSGKTQQQKKTPAAASAKDQSIADTAAHSLGVF